MSGEERGGSGGEGDAPASQTIDARGATITTMINVTGTAHFGSVGQESAIGTMINVHGTANFGSMGAVPLTLEEVLARDIIDFRVERGRHEHFIGREDIFAELDGHLCVLSSGWVVLTGGPGMGKSALLERWLTRREEAGLLTAFHFIRRGHQNWADPEAIQANLAAQIERMFPTARDPDAPPSNRLDRLLGKVSSLLVEREQQLVLLVDGLDEAISIGEKDNPIPKFFPASLPKGVSVVVASRPRYPHLNWFDRQSAAASKIDLDAHAESNAAAVEAYWADLGPKMEPPLKIEQARALIAAAEGNLLHAVKVRQLWMKEGAKRDVSAIPVGLAGVLSELWEQTGALEHKKKVRDGLSLLCAARESLPLSVLEELLEWDEGAGEDEFLPCAREMLLEEHWGNRATYRPFHESMRELVAVKQPKGARRSHETLVRFAAWPLKGDDFRKRYALRHRIGHLVAAAHLAKEVGDAGEESRLLKQAAATGLDVEYLAAQAREVGVVEVERNLRLAHASQQDAQRRVYLQSVERAVEASAHWLHRHPAALPTLVHDRLMSRVPDVFEALRPWPSPHPLFPCLRQPLQRLPSDSRVLEGHQDSVKSVAVLPDGRVVSASYDNTLRVWDLDASSSRILAGHQHSVNSVAMLPDGRLVSASSDRTLRIWDLATSSSFALEAHNSAVLAVAVLPDGRIVSASSDHTLRVWNVDAGTSRILEGHIASVDAVAVLPNYCVVSASSDHTLRVWDLEAGTSRILHGHQALVNAVAVLSDGRIVSASWDFTLRVWDLEAGTSRILHGHQHRVTAVAVLPDDRVVSASWDHTLRLWNPDAASSCILDGHNDTVNAVAILPDGRIVSASDDHTLRIWDLDTGASHLLTGHQDWVKTVTSLPDGRVVSGSFDRTLRVWDFDSSSSPSSYLFEGHQHRVQALAVLPNGRVVSASCDRTLRVWDLDSGSSHILEGHQHRVNALAGLPDGRVVSASFDRTLRVWDLDSGSSHILEGHQALVRCIKILPDGRVISASYDRTLRVWDLDSGSSCVLEGHHSLVTALAVLPDGRVVSASRDNTLRVWELHTGSSRVLKSHQRRVNALVAMPDGRIVSASDDNTLRVWDLESGFHILEGHHNPVNALNVLPDGRVVSGSNDSTIRVWNLKSGSSRVLEGHHNSVNALNVLPDGRIVSASDDNTLRVWDLESGTCCVVFGVAAFVSIAATQDLLIAGDELGNVWFVDFLVGPSPP